MVRVHKVNAKMRWGYISKSDLHKFVGGVFYSVSHFTRKFLLAYPLFTSDLVENRSCGYRNKYGEMVPRKQFFNRRIFPLVEYKTQFKGCSEMRHSYVTSRYTPMYRNVTQGKLSIN